MLIYLWIKYILPSKSFYNLFLFHYIERALWILLQLQIKKLPTLLPKTPNNEIQNWVYKWYMHDWIWSIEWVRSRFGPLTMDQFFYLGSLELSKNFVNMTSSESIWSQNLYLTWNSSISPVYRGSWFLKRKISVKHLCAKTHHFYGKSVKSAITFCYCNHCLQIINLSIICISFTNFVGFKISEFKAQTTSEHKSKIFRPKSI